MRHFLITRFCYLVVFTVLPNFIKEDVKVGGLMFADDFFGLTTNAEDLQTLNGG